MAASSSSGVGKISKGPQVFINFRGEELRNGFIAFLVSAMREANINVFIDDLEVRGTDLVNLLVRFEESRVALPISSKDYTNSVWCLDELVKIKECKYKGSLKVIPIFYKLEPSIVEYLQGSFGDNFRNLKRNHQHELVRTQKWEEALTSITQTMGLPLREQSDRSDKEFINSIITEVKRLLANITIKENQPRETINQGIFFVPARKLDITHSENPENWTWSSVYEPPKQATIEIATMTYVYWMDIRGTFHTKKLIPEIKYEVVFVVKLKETANGWEEPVNLNMKLVMPDKSPIEQEKTTYLDECVGDEWVDIKVGDFVAPPKDTRVRISFTMYQYDDTVRKTGLVVKGVAIRALN